MHTLSRLALLALFTFVLAAIADEAAKKDLPKSDAAAKDLQALQGTWELVSSEVSGKKMTAEELKQAKLVYKGEQYTVQRGTAKAVTGKVKLDPARDPKALDITDTDGPFTGKVLLGIYAVAGDELKECFALPGKSRPTKFAAGADSGQFLHVWKRVKEKE